MDADMRVDPNQMLTTEAAASLIGLKASTLAAWREDGSQPDLAFFKVGKAVRYRYRDIVAFVESRRALSTLAARKLAKPLPAQVTPAPKAPAKTRQKTRTPRVAENDQLKLF